ncbi:hypothetical protein [Lutibacter flavus]|uniref:Uncharacterized protein n=1 Tax=Lutibacter flavus TaxID=691689 RepID=A0A238YFP3_9FLAO|nr:hypothetical protein [Lutibacter flavus]SNR69957.1 hypothetical protein SAMN04488111_2550 [Lutibacter flavus]
MKSSALKQNTKESCLTLIKNTLSNTDESKEKIYINTLSPGFNYGNKKGQIITPKKCILL